MKPLVIYHDNCADGFGAAFAAWTVLGDEAEYLPMQYGKTDYFTAPIEGRDVYILDFSFPKPQMGGFFQLAKRVVWLDHHKTAFEMWVHPGWDLSIPYIEGDDHVVCLDNTKSGAMLAWEYFHPGEEVPMLIQHIDDYDRWQFRMNGTKELMKAVWSYAPWTFEQWNNFNTCLQDGKTVAYQAFIGQGAAILRAHEQNVQSVVEVGARRCCVTKYSTVGDVCFQVVGLAANCPPHLASDVGHELANQSGTYGLLWYIDKDGKCRCSLRSNDDYDVSAIAKAFGGGGHRNAAGFEIDIQTLLWWLR